MKHSPANEIGEIREAACWFKHDWERIQTELQIKEVFDEEADSCGWIYGPVEYREDTERARVLPKPFEDARLLVGEARVVALRHVGKIDLYFLTELEPSELKMLRELTLKAYRRNFPGAPDLPLHNIDQLIAVHGPRIAANKPR